MMVIIRIDPTVVSQHAELAGSKVSPRLKMKNRFQ